MVATFREQSDHDLPHGHALLSCHGAGQCLLGTAANVVHLSKAAFCDSTSGPAD